LPPISSAKCFSRSTPYSDSRTFTSVENWWRTPAADRAVEPLISVSACSKISTSVQPRAAR
jgi:hypothetical protein